MRSDRSKLDPLTTAVHKIKWRLLPLLVIMFVVNYIDRVNVGFVRSHIQIDLGIGTAAYGLGAGLFFVGYALFEIPSNLMMKRLGARLWLTRIMLTWGVVAMAMAFIKNETHFYICRFLLGAAEAGFFPGVAYFFTQWLPAKERAKAMAILISGAVLASAIAGPVSGALLQIRGFGLRGWQWMFLIEGFASVLLCAVGWRALYSYPREAHWLSQAEKAELAAAIANEQRLRDEARPEVHKTSRLFLDRNIILYCFLFFTIAQNVYAITFWLPSMIRTLGNKNDFHVGMLNSIPFLAGMIAMYLFAVLSSKRWRQETWLCITLIIASIGLFASTLGNPLFGFVAVSLSAIGSQSATAMFWPIPQSYLDNRISAAVLALINSVGTLGGFVGPSLFGIIEAKTGSIQSGLYVLASTSMVAAILVFFSGKSTHRHLDVKNSATMRDTLTGRA